MRMPSKAVVLDSSALLALLFGEPGADLVKARGRGGLISAVCYSESLAKCLDRGVPRGTLSAALPTLQLTVVPFDARHAEEAAALRPATRTLHFSFADRACLATAKLADLPALTADRAWAGLDLGIEVVLVRGDLA